MESTATSIDPSSPISPGTPTATRNLISPNASTSSNSVSSSISLGQKSSNNGGSKFPLAPVIGGVLGGVVLIITLVIIIVPCARRRQKRLKWLTEGDGNVNVLRRDVEASEPLKGSYRDYSRRSSEDKHSLSSSGRPGSIPRGKSSPYVNTNPKSHQQMLTPVMEDVAMSDSSQLPAYFPTRGPPLSASTAKLNPTSSIRTPRFPSFERLWPLTSAFRTSIYSSPSTRTSRTKSSAASSAPSRSRSRRASRRGRKEEPKKLNIDALISPMSLQQGVGLGRDSDPIDSMQIKHVRGAMVNDARYETAPMLPAMSAQNHFFNTPPPLPSPTKLTPSGQNGVAGHTMLMSMPTSGSQVSLWRDNSLTLRDPGSISTTIAAHQATMQPSTSKLYQAQLFQPQPQLSRESSTRQPQPFSFSEPVRPAPTLRHPERTHHHSRSGSDGSKYKQRRERERPTEFAQSSTLLPTTATDLGRPFQAAYPVGNHNGSIGRHHRQGSTSSNLDRQGSHRRTSSRSRSTSRTRSSGNQNTPVGTGHSHSRSLSNSGSATLTRSYSGSRGENPTGTGTGNGSGGSKLRRSAEHRRTRGMRPKIPSYEVNGQPPVGYRSGYEFNVSGNGNYMSV
ncbi:hypothetical protein BDM02DRAFT_3186269 [Thelephora ganbajun]|uniref:Uncharacterized protein n=1 Tax=Thelephora ganbajun TaxID=370292 RepID=A0ACB6ZJC2_THEGA|nr:hypothetical protein BDM02DRAFT_3186269 [Thelephora ganbajun]